MSDNAIEACYNLDLKPLEELLSAVRRPGSFFVEGSKEIPMPKIEVEGVGILSFPVTEELIKKLIMQASRAPFGRGEQTILDTNVRKAWQIAPEQIKIGGLSWEKNFENILATVTEGLGCEDSKVVAELYKLLVYEEGDFFQAHRDTEKTSGMFGTLVVVLPSMHRGGELVIRHKGHKVTVDLSGKDVSELAFVAFYADCEHEVLPITEGNRVCLVYNLIQQRRDKEKALSAPVYDAEVPKVALLLKNTLTGVCAPAKLVWMLEHEYSKAELSFTTLKNADSAIAKVLYQAAKEAGCAIHLGILHVEEMGSAEPHYDQYSWRNRYDDDDINEDFDVVDIFESSQYIDSWVDEANKPVDFGEFPVEDGELLPHGCLDDALPDEQRLHQSTGNDGASFERAYHRAAIVIWRRDKYATVLMQSGLGAVMTYFIEQVEASASEESRNEVLSLAHFICDRWQGNSQIKAWQKDERLDRSQMLLLLNRVGAKSLLVRFIAKILTLEYNGSEHKALIEVLPLLETAMVNELIITLISENMSVCPAACVDLLHCLMETGYEKKGLQEVAKKVVFGLGNIGIIATSSEFHQLLHKKSTKPMNVTAIIQLCTTLIQLKEFQLLDAAVGEMMNKPAQFDLVLELIPSLCTLHSRHADVVSSSPSFINLWIVASEFLLGRSEFSPKAPEDWCQQVKLACSCTDCVELQQFVSDPKTSVYYFRVREQRRQHLESEIRSAKLDMVCRTESTGSPKTLVCKKTRQSYEVQCKRYRDDLTLISELLQVQVKQRNPCVALRQRLEHCVNG